MSKAYVDIQASVKGMSDVEKLERRMQALEKEVKRLQTATPKAANAINRFGRSSRQAASGVKILGGAVRTALGPLVAITATIGSFTAAIRTIAGQDFALAKVRSLGVDSVALAKNLKEVSKELEGNASVAELTGAAYDVASAGFTNAADAALVLKAASLGAVGGFSDINTVGDAATSVLNAYGKSAKDAALLVDGFIQTQNDGKIVVDEYARNIGKVASAAAGLKVPIEEVNAVIAQSTAAGVQAEVAFTGLKGALARLASGEASKSLKDVGIDISAATIEADGLLGTLQKLEGLDTGQILKALGTEAGPALLPVIQNLERFEELLLNQENAAGAAARAQREAADTINGAWNRVRVAFENLFSDQAALAQAIIPILDAVANAVTGITTALEGLREVANAVAGVADSLGQKFGAVANALGTFGDAAKYAADQIGRLLLRADGFESMDKSGWGKGLRNVGADYKEQELALSAAANNAGSTAGALPQQTQVPGFGPGGSGGANEAAKAADEMERQLKAGKDLSRQFSRQIKLLQTKGKYDKELLRNQFELEDAIRQINETAAPLQREGLISDAATAKDLQDVQTLEKAMEGLAGDVTKDYTAALKKSNDELTVGQELAKGTYDIISGSLTDSIGGLIDGTKEWGDVLSDIAGQLGKMFLNQAFSGIGGLLGFAEGGRPPTGEVSVVGEKGPELFVPDSAGTVLSNQDSKAALSSYNRMSPDEQKAADKGEDPTSSGASAAMQPIRMDTRVINGVEYATVAQMQEATQQAAAEGAKQGAKIGEAQTLRRLRMNPSVRRQVGV